MQADQLGGVCTNHIRAVSWSQGEGNTVVSSESLSTTSTRQSGPGVKIQMPDGATLMKSMNKADQVQMEASETESTHMPIGQAANRLHKGPWPGSTSKDFPGETASPGRWSFG